MKPKQVSSELTALKALSIVILLLFWLTGLIIFLNKAQASIPISPGLLLHSSSLLMLLLLVRVFNGKWEEDLSISSFQFHFIILAIFFGLAFWKVQQFVSVLIYPDVWEQDARLWQEAQNGFNLSTVFIASCLVGPVFEELLFRGLIYNHLNKKTGTIWAMLISSALFTLLHWNMSEALWLFSAGVIYAILREKSGSIWPPVIAHIIQNVLTFWLYVSI